MEIKNGPLLKTPEKVFQIRQIRKIIWKIIWKIYSESILIAKFVVNEIPLSTAKTFFYAVTSDFPRLQKENGFFVAEKSVYLYNIYFC